MLARHNYRRYQAGASPTFTPLRSAGQYHDEETGLFENWNRYYHPGSGGYLQPEPLLEEPKYIQAMSKAGQSVPTYAFANNNPVYYVDRDGKCVVPLAFYLYYYKNLKDRSHPQYGKDKYAHCMANCMGTTYDFDIPCATFFAFVKESVDLYGKQRSIQDSREDMEANFRGLSCESPTPEKCEDTCARYLAKPRHFQ